MNLAEQIVRSVSLSLSGEEIEEWLEEGPSYSVFEQYERDGHTEEEIEAAWEEAVPELREVALKKTALDTEEMTGSIVYWATLEPSRATAILNGSMSIREVLESMSEDMESPWGYHQRSPTVEEVEEYWKWILEDIESALED